VLGGALAALFASLPALGQRPESGTFRHEIQFGKIAEECRTLAAEERVHYRFNASASVDFNVHFHRGDAVDYAVKKERVREGASTFNAPSAQDFCWMWANRTPETVVVQGEIIRKRS
jgi:hypothetical protein